MATILKNGGPGNSSQAETHCITLATRESRDPESGVRSGCQRNGRPKRGMGHSEIERLASEACDAASAVLSRLVSAHRFERERGTRRSWGPLDAGTKWLGPRRTDVLDRAIEAEARSSRSSPRRAHRLEKTNIAVTIRGIASHARN